MPNYWRMKGVRPTKTRKRAIQKLRDLRGQLDSSLPAQREGQLVLGTWNIRNFDDNRFGHGPRLEESFFYIAEIISRFDAIAVQELCRDIGPVTRLMRILGDDYAVISTDVTEGRSGNVERLAFIYDKRKVTFTGIAGELVLPDNLLISDVTKKRQFARTPFMCSFQSAWLKFNFSTVHIYYGKQSKKSPEYARRVAEIKKVASQLAKRAREDDVNHVLVGDFNIDDFEGKTFDALERTGFKVHKNKTGSNAKQNKFYDQIAFRVREGELRLSDADDAHGVFNLFQTVFTDDQYGDYAEAVRGAAERQLAKLVAGRDELRKKGKSTLKKNAAIKKARQRLGDEELLEAYYRDEWRTFQASDHFPLWVALDVDFTDDYLRGLA